MSAFAEALEAVGERTAAAAGFDPATQTSEVVTAKGDPVELVRKLLNGYVPLEDTERALVFLDELATTQVRIVLSGPVAIDSYAAGLAFTAAQAMAIGVELGRAEARTGEDST